MSIERRTTTILWCDMGSCLAKLMWAGNLPKKQAEKYARIDHGWRRDKVGRNVCTFHPKLRGARRGV